MQTIKAYIYKVDNPHFAVFATSDISDVDAVEKALQHVVYNGYREMQDIRVKVVTVYTNCEDVVYVTTLQQYLMDTKG